MSIENPFANEEKSQKFEKLNNLRKEKDFQIKLLKKCLLIKKTLSLIFLKDMIVKSVSKKLLNKDAERRRIINYG